MNGTSERGGNDTAVVAGAVDLPKLELVADDGARADIYLHGAQVASWVPAGERDDRLFLSARSRFAAGAPIRGGVPVSFPQFATEGALPHHGFARVSNWTLVRASVPGAASPAQALLRLVDTDATRTLWPHPFALELTVTVAGPTLTMGLAVTNTGAAPLAFTGALHTYLRVADIGDASVRGLQGVHYRDKPARRDGLVESAPALRIEGEVDRVYYAAPDDLAMEEPARAVAIRATGFPDTVVWNPGAARGAQIDDLEADGYRRMLCVEAVAVRAPVVVAPGATWRGTQTLTARATVGSP